MNHELLFKIARDAITEELSGKNIIDKVSLLKVNPDIFEKGAVFVTLNKNRDLRGCIGSLVAHRSLLDDLIANAKAAAFDDVRFLPLSKEELEDVKIEISLLSEPKLLKYSSIEDLKEKITPFKDGVILRHENKQATFLPQVWEQLNEFELFFSHLGQKAGLGADVLKLHPEIFTYRVESFSE